MLRADHLIKEFTLGSQVVRALDDLDLEIPNGEFVSVAGPSGSGKSTLLMSLGGLVRPTSGRVLHDEVDIYIQPPSWQTEFRQNTIGFVFQQFHLVPYLTAWENVALPLMLNGNHSQRHQEIATCQLDQLGLGSRLNHKPSQLSVGQQQRVALARTLVNNPAIILADEPTGSLDPSLATDLVRLLKDLNKDGKTIVLVTHSKEIAAAGSRQLSLLDGRICKPPH
ncbi:ABC transporter ATP-binding protein [Candidatus Zixiibacteriota bacterium]